MADLKEMLSKVGEMSPEDLAKAFGELPADVQKKVIDALAGAGGEEVKAVVEALPEEVKEAVRSASKASAKKEEEKPAEAAKEA